jgi:hypothetical protein
LERKGVRRVRKGSVLGIVNSFETWLWRKRKLKVYRIPGTDACYDSWTGKFSEANFSEAFLSGDAFWSDDWQGLGLGLSVGPVPASASYFDTVDYQYLIPQQSNQNQNSGSGLHAPLK